MLLYYYTIKTASGKGGSFALNIPKNIIGEPSIGLLTKLTYTAFEDWQAQPIPFGEDVDLWHVRDDKSVIVQSVSDHRASAKLDKIMKVDTRDLKKKIKIRSF